MRHRGATALVVGIALACATASTARTSGSAPPRWIASWGSAQMVPTGENALPADRQSDITLRQIVRLSAGGSRLRVRLSNAFGNEPLVIGAAYVARAAAPGTPRLLPGTGRPLTFNGRAGAFIPAGAEVYSDPVDLPVNAGADLAVSLYMATAPSPQTGHPGARATSFLLSGNRVGAVDLPDAGTTTRWYGLSDIEVESSAADAATLVAIGDSITDGFGVKPERNTRWTDVLAARLRAGTATRQIGLVNAGIGGNRVLRDGLGPNMLARFDRDVIARSGVRWAILLEGINDLGTLTRDGPATSAEHAALVERVTAAYSQAVDRAHAHGISVIGGTIMPFGGNEYYHPGPALEAARQAINRFIRTSGTFDAVIDFDQVMRDPAHPDRLKPALDSGDHLHPSEAGYRVMGEAVPLTLFTRSLGTNGRSAATGKAPPPAPKPSIALTFDDIPVHGPLPPGETRADVVGRIAATLSAAKVPAYGFLNGGVGQDDPSAAAAAIATWRRAGLPLGNHTYTHANLEQVGTAAFEAEVARNEAPLAAAGATEGERWFRYPFLSEGTDPAVRNAIRAALARRGYRVAAVTMSFADFNWNGPYAACAAKGNTAAIRRLEDGFLADARSAALAARAKAQAQVGRDIPYVLLMHVGAFDARMLPRLLDLYRSMGFRFTTLADAQADPYYAAAIDLTRPGPPPSLAGPPATPPLAGPPAGLCS